MSIYAFSALYCIFVWWFSTGIIVFLDNLPEHSFRWSLIGASAIATLALVRLHVSAADTSVAGAYAAFTYGVLVWGWHEMAFFMGLMAGPRLGSCPEGEVGWRRFRYGVEACLNHELAIVACAGFIVWMNWHAANQFGTWTFLSLWGMRLSAKLNVFLGVRNLGEKFLPAHISYLTSYMRRRPMNWLFPLSVTGGTLVVALLFRRLAAAGNTPSQAAGYSFLVTMMALAVVEHWILILPLPFEKLWNWWLLLKRQPPPMIQARAAAGTENTLRLKSAAAA